MTQPQATTEPSIGAGRDNQQGLNDQSREEPTNVGALPSPPEAR